MHRLSLKLIDLNASKDDSESRDTRGILNNMQSTEVCLNSHSTVEVRSLRQLTREVRLFI